MAGLRPVTLALLALLALVQGGLWWGEGGLPNQARQQTKLDTLLAQNADARRVLDRLNGEVQDLRQGLEMVEERARGELGMVKPDELFVQYATAATATTKP